MQIRNRAIAGVLLVPLLVAACCLTYAIPFGQFNFAPKVVGDSVYVKFDNGRAGVFNATTGEYRAADPREMEIEGAPKRRTLDAGLRLYLRFGVIERLDASGNQIAVREKSLFERVRMVNGRLVLSRQTGIELLDPRDLTVTASFKPSSSVSVRPIGQTDRFLLENRADAEQILVSIDATGITEIGRWPSFTPLPQQREDSFNRIFKDDTGKFHLEWRDTNGELTRSVKIPDYLNPATNGLTVHDGRLVVSFSQASRQTLIWDSFLDQNVAVPTSGNFFPIENRYAKLNYAVLKSNDGTNLFCRYDYTSGVTGDIVDAGPGVGYTMSPKQFRGTFVYRYGPTLVKFNEDFDGIEWTSSPFRWAAFLLPTTVVGFGLWCFIWVAASKPDGGWPAVDSVVLAGLLTGFLIARVAWVDHDHLLLNYCQGCFFGALAATSLWLTLGRARLSLRMLPFAIVSAALLYSLNDLVAEPSLRVEGLVTTLGNALRLLVVGYACRLLGVRMVNSAQETTTERPRLQLIDYFVICIAAAVMLPPLRPLLEDLDWQGAAGSLFSVSLVGPLAIGIAAVCMFLRCRWYWMWPTGGIVVLAIFAVDMPLQKFTYGYYYFNGPAYDVPRSVFGVVAMSLITAYLILLPFRARGWAVQR